MNTSQDFGFVKVNDDTLIEFLKKAKERIVIAKAGYNLREVETLIILAAKPGITCKVYMDPGENSVRWGFGEAQALQELQKNSDLLNLQAVDRIRMSIVIVDDSALIYTPVALSWETEPKDLKFPNGFIGGLEITEALLRQMDTPDVKPANPNNVIPFPGCSIPKKAPEETSKEISETLEKLKRNPPVDPAKLRQITVYRNIYKLLQYQVKGVNLKTKSINLRAFNRLVPDLDVHLKASWMAFTQEDLRNLREISLFMVEIKAIVFKYTLKVGRFGYLIKTEDREAFEKEIEKEKGDFLDALKLKPGEKPKNPESKYVKAPAEQQRLFDARKGDEKVGLASLIETSKAALKEYMNKVIEGNPAVVDALLAKEKALLSMLKKGELDLKDVLPGVLDTFIWDKLRFPSASDLIARMDVTLDYYDVSSELLYENVDFKNALQELKESKDPEIDQKIRELSGAFEKAENV